MSSAGWICVGILLLAISFGNASENRGGAPSQGRPRRSLVNLNSMVKVSTGRSGADFIGYGNWCGLGGQGRPLDPIDECCQIHDLCYNLTTRGPCHKLGEKAVYQLEYKWNTAADGNFICDEETDRCKTAICMCDVVLTDCLKKNMEFFDENNVSKLSVFELLKEAEWLTQP